MKKNLGKLIELKLGALICLQFLIIIFTGCSENKDQILNELISHKEFVIPQSNNPTYFFVKPKVKLINSKWQLSYINPIKRKIFFLEIGNESIIDSIDINFYKYQYIQDYYILNNDSIFLAFNTVYFGLKHDKCIILTNRNKDILDSASFKGAQVPLTNQSVPDSILSYSDYTYFPLKYFQKGYLFASLAPYYHKRYCDTIKTKKLYQVTGKVTIGNKSNFLPYDLYYECPKSETRYPNDFDYLRGEFDNNNRLYCRFGQSSYINCYNLNDNKLVYKKEIKSLFVSEINSVPIDKIDSLENLFPGYFNIAFNEYNKLFYQLVKLPITETAPPSIKNNSLFSIIVFNMEGDKIGEAILPYGYSKPISAYKNGFLAYNQLESKKQNKIIVRYFELGEKVKNLKNPMEYLQEKENGSIVNGKFGFEAYLNNFQNVSSNDTIILVPLNRSCHSCIDKLGEFLENNKLGVKNIPIILIANNKNVIDEYMRKFNLEERKDLFILHDNTNIQSMYIQNWANPKMVIRSEGVSERIFSPSDMKELFELLKKYKGLKN